MIKELLIMSLLSTNVRIDYVKVTTVEHYQSFDLNKKISFSFESDGLKVHQIFVEIESYDLREEPIKKYSNNLQVIGKRDAVANICVEENIRYVLIDIYYNEQLLYKDIKINFYHQEDCNIDNKNRICNLIYLSRFSNNVSKDYKTNVLVKNDLFDKYLMTNVLDLTNFKITSEYKFHNAKIYLIIENKIEQFNLLYNNGYIFELEVKGKDNIYFQPIEDNYVRFENFNYGEQYLENSIKTNKIVFPYSNDFKEYNCKIVIEDFVKINIKFNVATQGELIGDCLTSKFCTLRSKL